MTSKRAEDFRILKKVSWLRLDTGTRRVDFRSRWKSQNRKNVYLSPYVEEPLNSKVIKSFVPELRSRKCFSNFEIPIIYVICIWTCYVHFTHGVYYGYVTVFPCQLVWVYAWSGFCMGTAEDPFFKILCDDACERRSSWEFLQRSLFELSLHPHCKNILLSTSCQIWDFLPFCWGCLLTLWLEICAPNEKFGFSGDNC